MLEGTLTAAGRSARVENGKLAGEQISLSAVMDGARYELSGRIVNHAIEGTARVTRGTQTRELPWSATRTEIWDPRHAAINTEQALKELH